MAFVVCVAVLAVLAQANAYSIGCDDAQTIRFSSAPTCVSSVVPTIANNNLQSFEYSAYQSPAQNSERVDRTTYQVSLDNNGPAINSAVFRSQKQAPFVQGPTITLPARIPGTRTVSNQCKCIKTVVKPHVYEQVITVPIVQRYIQTTHRPVVEKIHYKAVPVNSQDNVQYTSTRNFAPVQSAPVLAVQAPRVEAPSFAPIQSASVFAVQAPRVEAPSFAPIQSAPVFAVQAPRVEASSFAPIQSAPVFAVQAPRVEASSFAPIQLSNNGAQFETLSMPSYY